MGDCAFQIYETLESVVFEEGARLQAIPKSIMIPDTVTIIKNMHLPIDSLPSIYFTPQSKLQQIEREAFERCHTLQFVNVSPIAIDSINNKMAVDQFHALPISSTATYDLQRQRQRQHWFQHGYDNLQHIGDFNMNTLIFHSTNSASEIFMLYQHNNIDWIPFQIMPHV